MPATTRTRTLGEFLCVRPTTPPVEDIDRLPWQDIKQDACLRAIIALTRAGKPVGPDPVAAFDAEPRLVMTAYQRARADAIRRHLGRDSRASARWRRLVSLDHGFTDIADPAQGAALDAVVDHVTAVARLVLLWQRGTGSVEPATMRKVLRTLRLVQRLRADDTATIPNHIRQRLHALRIATQLRLPTDRL